MVDFNKLHSISYRINKLMDVSISVEECNEIIKNVIDEEDYKRMLSSFALRIGEKETQQLVASLRNSIISGK